VDFVVPTVEGLKLAYALYPLAPGAFGFRRWRWELWHGATLVAAGWRVSPRDAERALWAYACRFGHRLFGLRSPDPVAPPAPETFRPGAVVRVDSGAMTCTLVPRALEAELAAAPAR
jgi:hypothetical protein